MSSVHRPTRILTTLWLTFFAFASVVLPVADAAGNHAPVAAHWEDASDASCPPRHDASTCQAGQPLVAGSQPAPAAPQVPVARRDAAPPSRGPAARTAFAPNRGVPASRAPPVA